MEAPNLHSRQKNLLSVLNKKHGAVSGKELAAALDVSERTIRSDIKEINSKLKTYEIQIVPLYGKGYTLTIKDRRIFVELFSERESYASKDDRVRTLMIRLLRKNDWCELGLLEDEMYVSHTTLENDLKTVKKRISARHPYLQMERKGNFVRLENNEVKRRDILIRSYAEYWDYDSREGIILKRDEFSVDLLRSIQNVLKKYLPLHSIQFDDSAFIYMALSIAVMYYRNTQGHIIRHTDQARPDSDISAFISDVVNELNKDWGIDFRRAEYIWLSDILRQLIIFSDTSHSKNKALANTDVLCHHIVNGLLKEIDENYGIDYTSNSYLFVDLILHVQALFDGVVAPQIQSHILGDELHLKYPFIGDIVHFSRLYLEEQCEIELGTPEEDYLFPFFISAHRALSRKCIGSGIPVGVICHTNNSITHYLMEQLRFHYKNELDIKGPYPIHAKERAADDDPFFLISTVHTYSSRFDGIPKMIASPLLEREDRRMIEFFIDKYVCTKLFGNLPKPLSSYFIPELIYTMNNKESLITTLSSINEVLHAKRLIGKLRPSDPVADTCVLLKNGLLFIYQINSLVSEPVLTIAYLKKSISWKHLRSVSAIMYMVISEEDRKLLGWFYFLARAIATKPELLEIIQNDKF